MKKHQEEDIERLDDYELLCEEDILGKEQPF